METREVSGRLDEVLEGMTLKTRIIESVYWSFLLASSSSFNPLSLCRQAFLPLMS